MVKPVNVLASGKTKSAVSKELHKHHDILRHELDTVTTQVYGRALVRVKGTCEPKVPNKKRVCPAPLGLI